MIIKSINIVAFGGLKNVKLDFTDNLNIVLGSNGAGKSTVMNFIKLMFYGKTENERSADISKSLRKKSKPLDGSKSQGSITFMHKGTEYLIEKTFGLTSNSDEVSITDITNGKKIDLGPNPDIGKYFLGLTLPQFERCCYILSNDYTKLETELSDIKEFSIKDVTDNSQETNKIFPIISKLKENYISKSKKKGLIIEKENELSNLFFKMTESLNSEKIIEELDSEFIEKKAEIEKIKNDLKNSEICEKQDNKLKVLLKKLDFKKKLANFDSYFSAFSDNVSIKEYVSLGEMFYQNILSRNRLKKEMSEKDDLINFEIIKKDFENANDIVSEINTVKSDINTFEEQLDTYSKQGIEKKKSYIIILLSFIFVIVFALFMINSTNLKSFKFSILFSVLTVLGVSAFVYGLKYIRKAKLCKEAVSDIKIKFQECSIQLDKLNLVLTEILDKNKVSNIEELNEKYYKQNAILSADNERFESSLNNSIKDFVNHISKFKNVISYDEAEIIFNEIKNNYYEKIKIESEYKSFLSLSNSEDEKIENLYDSINNIENYLKNNTLLSEYEKEILSKKISALSDELLNIKGRYPKQTVSVEELKKEEISIKSELDSLKKTYSAIELAEELIKESASELSLDFLPKLNAVASEILSELENNTNAELIITDNVIPKIKKDLAGSFIQSAYLSESEKNRVYLSLRFALINLIESQFSDTLPVFADDIFISYDKQAIARGISFINEMSKERQIIFFTFNKEFAENSDKINVECL